MLLFQAKVIARPIGAYFAWELIFDRSLFSSKYSMPITIFYICLCQDAMSGPPMSHRRPSSPLSISSTMSIGSVVGMVSVLMVHQNLFSFLISHLFYWFPFYKNHRKSQFHFVYLLILQLFPVIKIFRLIIVF